MDRIDLRSDTVTRPTPAMRKAMAEAEVGDDVFREDPTVRLLEQLAAARTGKEAALFVPTGTMGNQIAVNVWTRPGQEVIADADSHLFLNEAAGAAMVGGIQIRQVRTERGVLSPAQVLAALRPADDDHQPLSAAVMTFLLLIAVTGLMATLAGPARRQEGGTAAIAIRVVLPARAGSGGASSMPPVKCAATS